MNLDAALGEGQCDPTGADPQLERTTRDGQVGKKIDGGSDQRIVEHLGHGLVVAPRHAFAEVIFRHTTDFGR